MTAIGLWSTVEVVTRTILTEVPPIQLAWIRFFVGGVFLSTLLSHDLKRRGLRIDRRILWFCLWVSVPGVVVSNIALQYSLQLTGAAVVATVYGASPLFVLALSRLLLREPMDFARVAGLCFGLAGIAVLSLGKPSPAFSLAGLLLALCAAGTFSLWTVLVKKSAGAFTGLPVTVLCFAFGVLFMTPFALLESEGIDWAVLQRHAGSILYLSVGGTGLAYWLYFKGLAHVDATRAASIILLKPPVAALLASAVLGEALTWNLLVSMGLIGAGLYGVFFWCRNSLRHNNKNA
ncbi:MAG: EamA family transporter [Candidatus Hydrogenedentes bacterium]|nr:EamA family transporter [Candidatus Hydrogenedentota bacterium]